MSDDLKMQISLKGDMTKDSVDLYSLGVALINVQALFDRSYCFYTGHQRISSNDRKNFKIVAYDVKRGSIIFTAGLTAFALQQTLINQNIDPKLIFEATSKAFKFLKKLFSQTNKNQPPNVNIINSPGAIFEYNAGENIITASKDTASLSQSLRPSLRRMASVFNTQQGELTINALDFPEQDIKFDNKDAHLFRNQKVISDIPIVLSGVVKSFSVETLTGQFDVAPGNAISPGKYSFFIKNGDRNDLCTFIDSMKGSTINVTAYIEYEVNPTIQSNITKLYLTPTISNGQLTLQDT